jgi:hydrogenase small subunit
MKNVNEKEISMDQTSHMNLKLASSLAISFGITDLPKSVNRLVGNIKRSEVPPIVYLKGKTCTGCSVSLINFTHQSTKKLIVNHDNLISLSGSISPHNIAIDLIQRYISGKLGPYFFAIEGSIPKNPTDCYMANRPITDWIKQAGKTCIEAISFGNCAIVGNPNIRVKSQTDQISLSDYFMKENINKKVINIPGCPVNDQSIWDLIVKLVKVEYPEIQLSKSDQILLHKNI